MNWKIGDAKQRFSEVVRAAQKEPQWIYRRDELVGGLVEVETLKDYLAWRERHEKRTLAEAFAELRSLGAGEPDAPERHDRENVFVDILDRVPG